MLRKSARSIGLKYRRLWEVSIIDCRESWSCNGRGGRGGEYLPARNFHSQGFPAWNNFTDWESPRAKSFELKTYSVQKYNNVCSVMKDGEFSKNGRTAGLVVKSAGSNSSLTSVLVNQAQKTSTSVTSMLDENPDLQPNFSQRRPFLPSCISDYTELRTNSTPSRWMMMGGSLSSTSRSVCPSHQRTLGQTIRQATSKAGAADADDDGKSSEESPVGGAEVDKSAPRTIEDFQHEEIVGPTVERDLSDTADQVRESLTVLRKYMASFGTAFVLLGTVQLATVIWGSVIVKADSVWLWRDFSFVIMCYTFAYLLRNEGSAMEFFTKMEARSRLRIITLSLQVIKGLSQFFHRSCVVVKFVALTSTLLLVKETFPFS